MSRVENGIITDVTAETLGRIERMLQLPMEELLILDPEDHTEPQAKPKNSRKPSTKTTAKAKTTTPKRTRTPAKAARE